LLLLLLRLLDARRKLARRRRRRGRARAKGVQERAARVLGAAVHGIDQLLQGPGREALLFGVGVGVGIGFGRVEERLS
jgi:predicted ATPase